MVLGLVSEEDQQKYMWYLLRSYVEDNRKVIFYSSSFVVAMITWVWYVLYVSGCIYSMGLQRWHFMHVERV